MSFHSIHMQKLAKIFHGCEVICENVNFLNQVCAGHMPDFLKLILYGL